MAPPPKTERELAREQEARILERAFRALPRGGSGRVLACMYDLALHAIGGEELLGDIVRDLYRTDDLARVKRRAAAAKRKLAASGFLGVPIQEAVFYAIRDADYASSFTFLSLMETLELTGAADPQEVAHLLAGCIDTAIAQAWPTATAETLVAILVAVSDRRTLAASLAPFARGALSTVNPVAPAYTDAAATVAQMEGWIDGITSPPPEVDPVWRWASRSSPGGLGRATSVLAYFAYLPYASEGYTRSGVDLSGTAFTMLSSAATLFDRGRSTDWMAANKAQYPAMADMIRQVVPDPPSLREKFAELRPPRANPARRRAVSAGRRRRTRGATRRA